MFFMASLAKHCKIYSHYILCQYFFLSHGQIKIHCMDLLHCITLFLSHGDVCIHFFQSILLAYVSCTGGFTVTYLNMPTLYIG
jgi:hypothetical protein